MGRLGLGLSSRSRLRVTSGSVCFDDGARLSKACDRSMLIGDSLGHGLSAALPFCRDGDMSRMSLAKRRPIWARRCQRWRAKPRSKIRPRVAALSVLPGRRFGRPTFQPWRDVGGRSLARTKCDERSCTPDLEPPSRHQRREQLPRSVRSTMWSSWRNSRIWPPEPATASVNRGADEPAVNG